MSAATIRDAARAAGRYAAEAINPRDMVAVPETVEAALSLARLAESLYRLADLEDEASIADDDLDVPFMFRKPEGTPIPAGVAMKAVLDIDAVRLVQHIISTVLHPTATLADAELAQATGLLVYLDETFGPAL